MSENRRDAENIHLVGIDWRASATWLWHAGTIVLCAVIGASAAIVTETLVGPQSAWWVYGLSVGLLGIAATTCVTLLFGKCTGMSNQLWKRRTSRTLDDEESQFLVTGLPAFLSVFLYWGVLSGITDLFAIELPIFPVGGALIALFSATTMIADLRSYLRHRSVMRS